VPSVDEQHRKLFQYLNDLEDAVIQGDVSGALLVESLDFLEDYARSHFGNEEACMLRFKCPVAADNRIAHRRFIEMYQEYKRRLQEEGPSYALFRELLSRCEQWLVEHICRIDVQLKSCLP
ncbi:MAG: hemerythrin family protein, partial [Burkholderiales bacterium]|nr:hemerythrin family protein [Burkholderiales bacterium]